MNEQIENCLYQSGLTAQGCWDELDDYAKQAIEKFAELIVRECIRAYNDDGYQTEYEQDLKVLKHFGFE